MNKRITKVVGGAAVIGALALAALSGTGTASAQSLIAKVGITRPAHDGRGPTKSMTAVAGVLKLTEAELKTQLDSGKSLATVAATQNVSIQSVIDVIVADKQAYIAEEVASGEITQAQADAKLAEVTAKVTEKVNSVRPAGEGGKGGRGPAKSLTAVAGVLKLTEAELKTQLDSGKSLAAVAATQNVSVQSVIDVIVADKQAYIAEEVTSGELTQAQADEKLAEVTARATDMVNGVRPVGMGKGKHGEKGGHGGRGGHGRHGVEDNNA